MTPDSLSEIRACAQEMTEVVDSHLRAATLIQNYRWAARLTAACDALGPRFSFDHTGLNAFLDWLKKNHGRLDVADTVMLQVVLEDVFRMPLAAKSEIQRLDEKCRMYISAGSSVAAAKDAEIAALLKELGRER